MIVILRKYIRMHFLSHYYAELPNNNPFFVTGLIIPDLADNFTIHYNRNILKNAVPINEHLNQIHEGILQHYIADKQFHSSEMFNEMVQKAIACFISNSINRSIHRVSFIAHIAIEMMIDRQILLHKSQYCQQFYATISEADTSIISEYFKQAGVSIAMQSFLPKFQFFRDKQYLYLFSDLNNIVLGINKIYSLVTKVEFTQSEKANLTSALYNIDDELRYTWHAFFEKLDTE